MPAATWAAALLLGVTVGRMDESALLEGAALAGAGVLAAAAEFVTGGAAVTIPRAAAGVLVAGKVGVPTGVAVDRTLWVAPGGMTAIPADSGLPLTASPTP